MEVTSPLSTAAPMDVDVEGMAIRPVLLPEARERLRLRARALREARARAAEEALEGTLGAMKTAMPYLDTHALYRLFDVSRRMRGTVVKYIDERGAFVGGCGSACDIFNAFHLVDSSREQYGPLEEVSGLGMDMRRGSGVKATTICMLLLTRAGKMACRMAENCTINSWLGDVALLDHPDLPGFLEGLALALPIIARRCFQIDFTEAIAGLWSRLLERYDRDRLMWIVDNGMARLTRDGLVGQHEWDEATGVFSSISSIPAAERCCLSFGTCDHDTMPISLRLARARSRYIGQSFKILLEKRDDRGCCCGGPRCLHGRGPPDRHARAPLDGPVTRLLLERTWALSTEQWADLTQEACSRGDIGVMCRLMRAPSMTVAMLFRLMEGGNPRFPENAGEPMRLEWELRAREIMRGAHYSSTDAAALMDLSLRLRSQTYRYPGIDQTQYVASLIGEIDDPVTRSLYLWTMCDAMLQSEHVSPTYGAHLPRALSAKGVGLILYSLFVEHVVPTGVHLNIYPSYFRPVGDAERAAAGCTGLVGGVEYLRIIAETMWRSMSVLSTSDRAAWRRFVCEATESSPGDPSFTAPELRALRDVIALTAF